MVIAMDKGNIKLIEVKNIAMHQHMGEMQFLVILSGELMYYEEFSEHHMYAGDFTLINANPFHSMKALSDTCDVAVITFELDYLRQFFPYAGYTLLICDVFSDEIEGGKRRSEHEEELWNALLELIKSYINSGEFEDEKIIKIFSYLYKYFSFMNYRFEEENPIWASKIELYSEIYKLIVEEYRRKDFLAFINSKFYYSSDYLNRIFKSFIGVSLQESVNNYRCWASEKELIMTDDSIIDIAEKVGFSDSKYYYKYFKKWYGMTPAEFRIKWQENRTHPDQYRIMSKEEALNILETNTKTTSKKLDFVSNPCHLFIRITDIDRISGFSKNLLSAVEEAIDSEEKIIFFIHVKNGTLDSWNDWHKRLIKVIDENKVSFAVSIDRFDGWEKRVDETYCKFSNWKNLTVGSII